MRHEILQCGPLGGRGKVVSLCKIEDTEQSSAQHSNYGHDSPSRHLAQFPVHGVHSMGACAFNDPGSVPYTMLAMNDASQ